MSVASRLRESWSSLAPRDQRALRIGGTLLAVLLPVLAAMGVHDLIADRRAQLAQSRVLADAAGRRVAARLAAGADLGAAPAGVAAALQPAVARAVQRAGLGGNITVVQAVGTDRVQLVLRDAPFDAVTAMVAALARWDGITVVSADLSRSAPGRVEASLLLRGP